MRFYRARGMLLIVIPIAFLASLGMSTRTEARDFPDGSDTMPPALPFKVQHRDIPNNVLARRLNVTLPTPAALEVRCVVPGTREAHVIRREAASEHGFILNGLRAETTYDCQASATIGAADSTRHFSFTTGRLPFGLRAPVVKVPSSDVAQTGYTLYNYGALTLGYSQSYLVIVDAEGEIRWYHDGVGAGQFDVSYLGDGLILYGGEDLTEFYPPTIIDLDHLVHFEASTEVSTPSELEGTYHHDAGLSFMGDSVFTLTHATIDDSFAGFVIKEITFDGSEVRWVWDSDLDGRMTGALPDAEGSDDPYHANAVWDQWEDGRLYVYVGLRDLQAVIKIDYETKALVWQLGVNGDFDLLEADGSPAADSRWFFQNHDAKIYGNQVFLYDNGTARVDYGEESYSRAVILELDQEAFTARLIFEYREDNWAEPVWGGFDLLPNDNRLLAIGHSWITGAPDRKSTLMELSPDGEVVWRLEARSRVDTLYRAQRIAGCDIFENTEYCPERP